MGKTRPFITAICLMEMYQLEIKFYLIHHLFPPSEGWNVLVDIDAMERAKGNQHPDDKKEKVERAESALVDMGVRIGVHKQHGRVDVVASHPDNGIYIVEVEGKSSKQKEQAMYSALGQTVLMMGNSVNDVTYGIAVPDIPMWERQLQKIPARVRNLLNLKCYLVSSGGVREI